MSAKKPATRLTIRLPVDLAEAAAEAAKEAGMAVSDYHRFALRQAVDRQSAAAEMAAVEERMAAQLTRLHRRFGQLHQAQQFQFAVLDQFMKMALTLEPDFADEASRAAARATGRTTDSDGTYKFAEIPALLGYMTAEAADGALDAR